MKSIGYDLNLLVYILLCIFSASRGLYHASDSSIDVLWSFDKDNDFEGWARSDTSQSHIESIVINGELRGSIKGSSVSQASLPYIDSPRMSLSVSNRHYVMLRMAYQGQAKQAQLLIKSGVSNGPPQTNIYKTPWLSEFKVSVLSENVNDEDPNHPLEFAVDGNYRTYYLSNKPNGVLTIFNLGQSRWVNFIKILPIEGLNSPKRCLLQKSLSSGVGPFETISQFTIPKSRIDNSSVYANGSHPEVAEEHVIDNFEPSFGQYWRLVFIDNYGGQGIGIRNIVFEGYQEEISSVSFNLKKQMSTTIVSNFGSNYNLYYIPLHNVLSGNILQLRIEFLYETILDGTQLKSKYFSDGFAIDYIGIVKAPYIISVTGCLDTFSKSPSFSNSIYNVSTHVSYINRLLPLHWFTKNAVNESYRFSMTYDCPLEGSLTLQIAGYNFGSFPEVSIGNKSCTMLRSEKINNTDLVHCVLPPSDIGGSAMVQVSNGKFPGLSFAAAYLSYRIPAPKLDAPIVTNIFASSVDLVWNPTSDIFSQLTVTGYIIAWFHPDFPNLVNNCTVGNITSTTIRGLLPSSYYVFKIAAVSEGAYPVTAANLPIDQYGRRELRANAVIGEFSDSSLTVQTFGNDFNFNFFNVEETTSIKNNESTLPDLVLVGNANIENCNVSSTCCDGYNATIGLKSCGDFRSVCTVISNSLLSSPFVVNGISRINVPSNLAGISFLTLSDLKAMGGVLPSSSCGPALRLTSSAARESGAMWFSNKRDVQEGFDTRFSFRISNPSYRCKIMDDVNTFCRSRGADGLAFVLQNSSPLALGEAGKGLGYQGIPNALAVELDTYFNFDNLDFYENHIAVMTKGFRYNISSNHSFALATTTLAPDLTDGIHTVRIKYDPVFDEDMVGHRSFQANEYSSSFTQNADFGNGGLGDWGRFGLLYVYIDDMFSPVISTPLDLGQTIELDNGQAYVGITAATGDNDWQAHDVLNWNFHSLRRDTPYTAPFITEFGEGGYDCVDPKVCVHRADLEHYLRSNSISKE